MEWAALTTVLLIAVSGASRGVQQPAPVFRNRYNFSLVISSNNPLQIDKYLECFLGNTGKKCDEDGRQVKAVLAEALATDCARCTEEQRAAVLRMVRFAAQQRPGQWRRLEVAFDPQAHFRAAHPALFRSPSSGADEHSDDMQKEILRFFESIPPTCNCSESLHVAVNRLVEWLGRQPVEQWRGFEGKFGPLNGEAPKGFPMFFHLSPPFRGNPEMMRFHQL